jgi:hypothetical protein
MLNLGVKLKQFHGSEVLYNYQSNSIKLLLTEGVKYLIDNASAYWLIDLIASYQFYKYFQQEPFQTWKLKSDSECWSIIAKDGNNIELAKQDIEYSDFPIDEITLWLVDGVIMLPSEY